MNPSSISLLSILVGIFAANIFAFFKPKYSFELIGNSIAGVFGSVLFIKSFGRLGFSPLDIVHAGSFNFYLLFIHLVVSILGGIGFLFFVLKLKTIFEKKSK